MNNLFVVSSSLLLRGNIWTLILSVFSHNIPLHLLLNMVILFSFGKFLENFMGSKKFLFFFCFSGISGSLIHCLTSSLLLHRPDLQALGASGSISGLLIFFSLNFPTHLVYFFGLIPIPSFLASLLFVTLDIWGLLNQVHGDGLPIGHGAHLGGALFGLAYYFFYFKKFKLNPDDSQ